ncbi:hypothetical protein D3C73_1527790 [compost metagenome]
MIAVRHLLVFFGAPGINVFHQRQRFGVLLHRRDITAERFPYAALLFGLIERQRHRHAAEHPGGGHQT